MKNLINIKRIFQSNIESVYELMEFDQTILAFTIDHLEKLKERVSQHKAYCSSVEKTLLSLRKIKVNDSLASKYITINNQCVVLLVSYFGSTIKNLFTSLAYDVIQTGNCKDLNNEELKFKISELKEIDGNLRDNLGEIIISKQDISFQDMQSIGRAFQLYFNFFPSKTVTVNNIILGQACRHNIVHEGETVTDKLIRQVSGAVPRDLKCQLIRNERINFSNEEIKILAESMNKYLNDVISNIEISFNR